MKGSNLPYTYLIGWREKDVWYYGVRYAKGCNPEDLWSEYFTSSKYVHAFREEHGEPDVVKVHKIFKSKKEACLFEQRFLQRVNAKRSPRWLNEAIGGFPMGGSPDQLAYARRPKTEEHKRKIWEANKERWNEYNATHKGENHPGYGKPLSEETRRKISESNKGTNARKRAEGTYIRPPCSEDTKEKISKKAVERIAKWKSEGREYGKHNLGKKLGPKSEEAKKKISKALRGIKRSEETKQKCRASYNNSDEARRNRSLAQQRRRARERGELP